MICLSRILHHKKYNLDRNDIFYNIIYVEPYIMLQKDCGRYIMSPQSFLWWIKTIPNMGIVFRHI
jgi:hypothetical protein